MKRTAKQLIQSSGAPLYQQLKELLIKDIQDGKYSIGEKLPSSAQLCKTYNISLITVRRTIADLTAEGVLEGIFGKGVYVAAIPYISQNETKQIGIVFPELDPGGNPFYALLIRGIERVFQNTDYQPIIVTSNKNPKNECAIIDGLLAQKVAGIIITPETYGRTKETDSFLTSIIQKGFPLVFADVCVPGIEADYITCDNKQGGYTATKYLTERGHRRIGFVATKMVPTIAARVEGYRQALEEAHLPFDPDLIRCEYPEMDNVEGAYRITLGILDSPKPPTALFASTDQMALGIYRACYEKEVVLGQDLAVIGYDNLPFSQFLFPALTTIEQPIEEMGKKAGQILYGKLQQNDQPIKEIILANKLIQRHSCGENSPKQETGYEQKMLYSL